MNEKESNRAKDNIKISDTFFEKPIEEVEDGYFDERGFYTIPNGSFWDENETYFNHLDLMCMEEVMINKEFIA